MFEDEMKITKEKNSSLNLYKKYKINVLRQFGCKITKEIENYIENSQSETDIDIYCRSVIMKQLSDE